MSIPLDDTALYHLVGPEEWSSYQRAGSIAPGSLETEGFVHCSWGHQVAGTVVKHFSTSAELLALRLDSGLIGSPIVEEDSSGSGQRFPHAHGPIDLRSVIEVVILGSAEIARMAGSAHDHDGDSTGTG